MHPHIAAGWRPAAAQLWDVSIRGRSVGSHRRGPTLGGRGIRNSVPRGCQLGEQIGSNLADVCSNAGLGCVGRVAPKRGFLCLLGDEKRHGMPGRAAPLTSRRPCHCRAVLPGNRPRNNSPNDLAPDVSSLLVDPLVDNLRMPSGACACLGVALTRLSMMGVAQGWPEVRPAGFRALGVWIQATLCFSGSEFCRGADFQGTHAIRRTASGTRTSARRPASEPETLNVVHIRAVSALVRAQLRPVELRACLGRPPQPSTSDRDALELRPWKTQNRVESQNAPNMLADNTTRRGG